MTLLMKFTVNNPLTLTIMTNEERKAIEMYQAKIDAEIWCDSHGISKTLIRETENGYQVVKSFNVEL